MRLFVPITRAEFEALAALARAERRRPQDQAATIIARALSAHGPRPAEPFRALSDPGADDERCDDERA